ncbi:MAG: right-handed parallel beta-helix repeat-containing protein [Actinomycetota bacterium]
MGVRRGSLGFVLGALVPLGAVMIAASPANAAVSCDKIAAVDGSDGGAGTLASPYGTPQRVIDSLAPGQTGCLRGGTYTFSETDVTTPNITLSPYGDESVTLKGSIKVKPPGHHSTIEGMKLNGAGGTSSIGPKIYADGTVLRDNEITNGHAEICVQVSAWYDGPAPEGVVIERNRIHHCGEIPSTNMDHGIYLSEARDVIVRDNWIYDNADRGVQQYFEVEGARITGNVIFNNGDGVNFSGGSDQIVAGNIIAGSDLGWNVYAGSTGSPGEGALRDNCVHADNSGYTSNGGVDSSNVFSEARNLVAKPSFADPAAGDFRLKAGNACLAKYTGTMALPAGGQVPPPPPPPSPPPTGGPRAVTLRASARSVSLGRPLKLRGSALGSHSARRAVIQKRTHRQWKRVRALKLRDGRFALRLRARTQERTLRFRARVGQLGHSRTVLVKVKH